MGRKRNQTPKTKTPRRASKRIKHQNKNSKATLFESESDSDDIILKQPEKTIINQSNTIPPEREEKSLVGLLQETQTAEDTHERDFHGTTTLLGIFYEQFSTKKHSLTALWRDPCAWRGVYVEDGEEEAVDGFVDHKLEIPPKLTTVLCKEPNRSEDSIESNLEPQ